LFDPNCEATVSRWLGAILLAALTALGASGPAAAQADDFGVLASSPGRSAAKANTQMRQPWANACSN
jgi:hypothetical protein